MIFLDTNILSYYFNGDIKIRNRIVESLNKKKKSCLTVINAYEILKRRIIYRISKKGNGFYGRQ
jgi:predicted nucleic acid-binding protein